jgi:integrase
MEGGIMTTIESTTRMLDKPRARVSLGEDKLAGLAVLARYRGRTLEAYCHGLRCLFRWAADHSLAMLAATRTHLELYRTSMEERGLAASTIDRRLSTACGFYRFAHIVGASPPIPPSMSAAPRSTHPSGGLDRGELARFLYTAERFDTMVAGRTLDARWASWHTHAGHLETICSSVVKGCDLRISRGGGVWLLMAATGLDGGRWTANRGARRRWWYDDDPESG